MELVKQAETLPIKHPRIEHHYRYIREYLLHAVDNSHLLHASVAELRKDQNLDAAALAADVLACIK